MRIFIDTGAFCALSVPKDQFNLKAKSLYHEIMKEKVALYTSNYVLDEVYTLLKTRDSHITSVRFMSEFEKSNITVLRITEEIEETAKAIFKKHDDRRLSFTDCTSFALVNHLKIEAVFAFDAHFKYHPFVHTVKLFA